MPTPSSLQYSALSSLRTLLRAYGLLRLVIVAALPGFSVYLLVKIRYSWSLAESSLLRSSEYYPVFSPAGGMATLPRIVIVAAFPGFSICLLEGIP